jgi:glycosyltransferase involved in cell wall biosynthesis
MSDGTEPDLSIVVPVYNEEACIAPLVAAVRNALGSSGAWELLLIDDGSTDGTAAAITEIARNDFRIRLLRLARNYGQTPAMQAGFDHARARFVISMDGDLQNDPRDIPTLVEKLREGYDLVAGYRVRREDTLATRRIPSWVANRLIRAITGIAIRDTGCSLKAYRRELLDRMHLYSDMHRFIPAVAAATAGARIVEVPVRHHPRLFGQSKYGLSRVGKVIGDLLVIKMIQSFRERPLTMFCIGAAVAFLFSFMFAAAWGACAAGTLLGTPCHSDTMVMPTVSLLTLGLGWYLVMLGLIAQSLIQQSNSYPLRTMPIVKEFQRR